MKHADHITLSRAISLGDGPELATEFRLFAAGEIDTSKGKFVFDETAARDVIAAYEDHGNELPLDYDHAMADPFTGPRDRVAAGWFNLEVRDGELWAVNVRWTPRAAKELADREWRYMSPWFTTSSNEPPRRITRLINCALTNLPATKHLTPIAASMTSDGSDTDNEKRISPQKEDSMKVLLGMLGCAEGASEADAIAALSKREDAVKQVTALTGKATLGESLAQLSAWKEQAAKSAELEARLAAEKKEREDAAALSSITKAFDEKRITPAQVETAKKIHADHGSAALAVFLSAFVTPQVAPTTVTPNPRGDADAKTLTDVEKRIAHSLGIPLEQALANKLSQGGAA